MKMVVVRNTRVIDSPKVAYELLLQNNNIITHDYHFTYNDGFYVCRNTIGSTPKRLHHSLLVDQLAISNRCVVETKTEWYNTIGDDGVICKVEGVRYPIIVVSYNSETNKLLDSCNYDYDVSGVEPLTNKTVGDYIV